VANKTPTQQILHFFANPEKENIQEFNESLNKIWEGGSDETNRSAFMQLSDINSLRFPSAIVNADLLKKTNGADGLESAGFYPLKPDSNQYKIQELMVVFQLTCPGAPFILYGDEGGMWGAGYPDNLKPMLWNEFLYEKESYENIRPDLGKIKSVSENQFDYNIFNIYRKLNDIRKETEVLVKGEYEVHLMNEETGIFAYSRKHRDAILYVFMNLGEEKQEVIYNPDWKKNQKVKDVIKSETFKIDKFELKLELSPKSYRVLLKE
jgi:glycosidase